MKLKWKTIHWQSGDIERAERGMRQWLKKQSIDKMNREIRKVLHLDDIIKNINKT